MISLYEKLKEKTFIIAEIGNNHNGSKEKAKELIDVAAEAGVDAVKFQTFRGVDIVTPLVKANEYKGWNIDKFDFWYEFLDSIALKFEDHSEVYDYAYSKGIIPMSTPTSPDSVDFLESINNPIYKIASMDVTNLQLLKKVASTGKPVILSTGMSNESEIESAIEIFSKNEFVLLHCISDYPVNPENVNLKTITYFQQKYSVLSGLSDHAITNEFAISAVALGAKVIEKHITNSRNTTEKAEHHFSLEPNELKSLVCSIRILEKGLGEVGLKRSPNEEMNKLKYRRSLHLNKAMKKGCIIKNEDISVLRPNTGDAPDNIEHYIGKKLTEDVQAWSGLTKKMIGE